MQSDPYSNSFKGMVQRINVDVLDVNQIDSNEESEELFKNQSKSDISYDQSPNNNERPDITRFNKRAGTGEEEYFCFEDRKVNRHIASQDEE